jgi:hypothetical protein
MVYVEHLPDDNPAQIYCTTAFFALHVLVELGQEKGS